MGLPVLELPKAIKILAKSFATCGYELSLVGGVVRDYFLKRPLQDWDFTTNANPDQILAILQTQSSALWVDGREYGTIAGRLSGGETVEITTYRADSYDYKTRKPTVEFGDNLEDDLKRRDFTINAMALKLPQMQLFDLHSGIIDLTKKIIKTPIDPSVSFHDDPLRMLRAIRFVSQLPGFSIESNTFDAIIEHAKTLEIVSIERIKDEFCKILLGENPTHAIDLLVKSGLCRYILPEFIELIKIHDTNHRHKDVYMHSLKVLDNGIALEKTRFVVAEPAKNSANTTCKSPLKTSVLAALETIDNNDGKSRQAKLIPPADVTSKLKTADSTDNNTADNDDNDSKNKNESEIANTNVDVNVNVNDPNLDRLLSPNLTLRLACLLHDVGKVQTRRFEQGNKVTFYAHDVVGAKIVKKALRRLKFDNNTVKDVSKLVQLHMRFHGYSDNPWQDSGVRRYVHDADKLLEHLHILSRADITTQNEKYRNTFISAYDQLELRIKELKEREKLDAIRPSLNGDEIMQILNIEPGVQVGQAYRFLLDLRFEQGEMSKDQAKEYLLQWWKTHAQTQT